MKRKTKMIFSDFHPFVCLLFIVLVLTFTFASINPQTALISFILAYLTVVRLYGLKVTKQLLFLAIPVIIFAVFIIPLFSHNGVTPIFYINNMAVTVETIIFGLVAGCILMAVIMWFYAARIFFDDEKFLYLTSRIFPTIAMLISIAFRMIPLFVRRYRMVSEAQQGLGRRRHEMNFTKKISFFMKKISILISWSLEKSINTTISMESRGYGSGRRTYFHLFRFRRRDLGAMVWMCILSAYPFIMEFKGSFKCSFFPEMHLARVDLPHIMALIMIALVCAFPFIAQMADRLVLFADSRVDK